MNPLCSKCKNWVLKRRRFYEDSTENIYFEVKGGNGWCDILQCETQPSFGCNRFEFAETDHIVTDVIPGQPWQNWHMGPCPDCRGRGCGEGPYAGACYRCVGTGNVRFYDDGYIGEERTRRHPKEPPETPYVDPNTILAPVAKPNVL